MEGPPAEGSELPDELWETATRYRAGLKWPAHDTYPQEDPAPLCAHCTRKGKVCGAPLDAAASHAVHCHNGPCTNNRHNAVARALGALLKDLTDVTADFEQRLPQLDYIDAKTGKNVEAIMDVVHEHPRLGTLWVDVACVSAQAGDAERRLQASRRDGTAAERAADYKLRRYSGQAIPFILELGGRPSESARAFVQKLLHANPDMEDDCPWQGAKAWGLVSCALQRHLALQLRRAHSL